MTTAIEFSLMLSTADEAGTLASIQPLLDEFEAEEDIHVRIRSLSWDTGWNYLIKVGLYGDGPDVSEIGSTWLGDLIALNALHAFDEQELNLLGTAGTGPPASPAAVQKAGVLPPAGTRPPASPAAAFLPSAWMHARLLNETQTWAIPWLAGARLIFYRRALLENACVDVQTAFQDAGQFERTVRRLQERGVPVPWTVPTGSTHTTLLNVASWVWSAGGDFTTPDGKRTLFNHPQTREGIRAYFALGRYLASSVRHLNALEPDDQFLRDPDTAMTLSGSWLFGRLDPDLRAQTGVALPLSAPFVGGSYLVLWKHSAQCEAALKLIRFLSQTAAQVTYGRRVGLLPAAVRALLAPPFSTDLLWQTAGRGLQVGRSFPVIRSWGLMEDRLSTALAELWAEVLADPDLDLDAAVAAKMEPLAKRLDLVLGQA
jgi:multiple sugar transport system substrate-binding protein